MRARIYQPARNVMQSGTARTRGWVLEFAPASEREIDPLMGWTSSEDTQAQVRLRFDTREQAEAYARAHGIDALVQSAQVMAPEAKGPSAVLTVRSAVLSLRSSTTVKVTLSSFDASLPSGV